MTVAVSIVIPAHDEVDNLDPLLDELRPVADAIGAEVLLVDDGSGDGSAAVLARRAMEWPALRPLVLDRRRGQSHALVAGFDAARGELIVTLDADRQYAAADIPRVLERAGPGRAAVGVRRIRNDDWRRRLSSRAANAARRAVLGDGLSDSGCALKAFARADVQRLPRFDGMHRFLGTLLLWQGCEVVEVEVDHRPRRAGRSKYGIGNRLGRATADLLAMWWLRSRLFRDEVR